MIGARERAVQAAFTNMWQVWSSLRKYAYERGIYTDDIDSDAYWHDLAEVAVLSVMDRLTAPDGLATMAGIICVHAQPPCDDCRAAAVRLSRWLMAP